MANVHMQTAAKNLEMAVSDIRSYQQQLRSDAEAKKRELTSEINELKRQQSSSRSDLVNSNDRETETIQEAHIVAISKRVKELEREIHNTEDQARKDIADAEQRAIQITTVAKQVADLA